MRLALLSLLIASFAGIGLSVAISPNAELLDSRGRGPSCKAEDKACTKGSECCYKNCLNGRCNVSGH